MFAQIEERFVAAGRTAKGRRARSAIFRATRQTLAQRALNDSSLDMIADRAGLTQAALRHHFATRDELMTTFFLSATDWLQAQVAIILARKDIPARTRLEHCLAWHLGYMEEIDTVIWLETSAYWLRQERMRRVRDDFYRWLMAQYADLVSQIQPTLNARERQRRAYVMLTIILGSWITHGRGSSVARKINILDQRQLLLDTVLDIATE